MKYEVMKYCVEQAADRSETALLDWLILTSTKNVFLSIWDTGKQTDLI